jgi:hypothetical protein
MISSVFTPIAIVPYSAWSMFTDTTYGVNPQITSYQYRISVVDSCGNESALSPVHQTINLSPPIWNPSPPSFTLYWTDYVGFSFSQYQIWRDDYSTGNWHVIDSVSYILPNQYTDPMPPSDSARYFIQAIHPTGCYPSLTNYDGWELKTRPPVGELLSGPLPPVPTATINTTKSNTFKTGGNTAVSETALENSVRVYPNPSSGKFRVESLLFKIKSIEVYSVFGERVCQSNSLPLGGRRWAFDLSNHPPGIYFLRVETEQGRMSRKIMVR